MKTASALIQEVRKQPSGTSAGNRTMTHPPAMVEFVDLTQYAATSLSDVPLLIVNGTEPIGAAAGKLKSKSEKAPSKCVSR